MWVQAGKGWDRSCWKNLWVQALSTGAPTGGRWQPTNKVELPALLLPSVPQMLPAIRTGPTWMTSPCFRLRMLASPTADVTTCGARVVGTGVGG